MQDDFGIPLAAFRPDAWNFQPFGAYLGPIAIFPGRGQPRLGELFKKAKAPPLDFGIGYRHRGHDSNLLLAVRKEPLKLGSPQTTANRAGHDPDRPVPRRAPGRTTQHAPPLRGMAADDRAPAPAGKTGIASRRASQAHCEEWPERSGHSCFRRHKRIATVSESRRTVSDVTSAWRSTRCRRRCVPACGRR